MEIHFSEQIGRVSTRIFARGLIAIVIASGLVVGCTEPPTDDRLDAVDGEKRWTEFKKKLSDETASRIENNLHLAPRTPFSLTWCDYIMAPDEENYLEVITFLEEELANHRQNENTKDVAELTEHLLRQENEWDDKQPERTALRECLEAYGPLPERKIVREQWDQSHSIH